MDPKIAKKTQDSLGKIIKKPPLTEKLLGKPPFRFLHDIMTSVIKTTGFMKGLFTDTEMNSDNVKDRDAKTAFLQKAIDLVSVATGKSISARPAKIVAGHEPEKTNEFLQALAAAINAKVDNEECVNKVLNKGSSGKSEEKKTRERDSSADKRQRDEDQPSEDLYFQDQPSQDLYFQDQPSQDLCFQDQPSQDLEEIEGEDKFHVISDEDIQRSLTMSVEFECAAQPEPNMTCSSYLNLKDLENGDINNQSEIWIKPGMSFVILIQINKSNTVFGWEFTSYPKDVVFSATYRQTQGIPYKDGQVLVPPCKCDSHKEATRGELAAKQQGIHTLIFDNTYSKMTSKRVNYSLFSSKSSTDS